MKKEIILSFLIATGVYAAAHSGPVGTALVAGTDYDSRCPANFTYDELLQMSQGKEIKKRKLTFFSSTPDELYKILPHYLAVKTKRNLPNWTHREKSHPQPRSSTFLCKYYYESYTSGIHGGKYHFEISGKNTRKDTQTNSQNIPNFSHLLDPVSSDDDASFEDTPPRTGHTPPRSKTPPPLPPRNSITSSSSSSSSHSLFDDSLSQSSPSSRSRSGSSSDDDTSLDSFSPPRYRDNLGKKLRKALEGKQQRMCRKIIKERDRLLDALHAGTIPAKTVGAQFAIIEADMKSHNCDGSSTSSSVLPPVSSDPGPGR